VTARPLVTVVLPVHNGERFLAEAIDSVLTQDYEPLELIVVDDGSTDGSGAIASSRGVRVCRQANEGPAAARNTGIERARGELVAFIDADDVWLPGKLGRQVGHLLDRPELGFLYTSWTILLEDGGVVPPQFGRDWQRPHAGCLPSSLLVRRDVFDCVGVFDASYDVAEDAEWFARASDAGVRYDVLPDVLVRYRIHDSNAILETRLVKDALFRALRESAGRKRSKRIP
jgi:glycosyltransferase involved in cell wall biosynthesis